MAFTIVNYPLAVTAHSNHAWNACCAKLSGVDIDGKNCNHNVCYAGDICVLLHSATFIIFNLSP